MDHIFHPKNGYIAIVTALILSLIMLSVVVSVGTTSFLSSISKVDAANKTASFSLAYSCLELARFRLSENYYSYTGNETSIIGGDSCNIYPIETSGQNKIIKTKAIITGATTNLKLTVDNNLNTVTFEELPTL